ncbi:hypothetical protein BpHYR1_015455 [Brachionus plicatilis]|uniref:Helitron helicase-like domain-containing protein n=1 Tax=Brachionus plicatilis TaxID=10195 RepID=A0A3M7PTG4_BRAPC|nr:hypothetical protein BpHYR1_015455 [Brachionus plicatilis]
MRPFDANENAVILELFTQRNDSGGRLKDADIASTFRRRCQLDSDPIPVVRPSEPAPQESAFQEPEPETSLVQEQLAAGDGQTAGPSSESSVAQRRKKEVKKTSNERSINRFNHVSVIGILDTAFVEPYPVTDGTVSCENNREVSLQRTLNDLAAQIQVPVREHYSSDPVVQPVTDDVSSDEEEIIDTFTGRNFNRGWRVDHARKSERIRLQALRQEETLDVRQDRLATQISNNDQRLRAESPESESYRLASQRAATSVRQANFSTETLVQRRTTERNRIAQNRLEESPTSQNERLANRRVSNETEEERAQRLHLVHIKNQAARFVSNTHNTWKNSDPFVAQVDDQGDGTLYCQYCGAIYWIGEVNDRGVYTKCCQSNKIELSPIQHYHPVMIGLLDPQNSRNFSASMRKEFLDNIRQYNSSLGMASVKANFDAINLDNIRNDRNRISESRTTLPFLYKVHGAVAYGIPPMFNGQPGIDRIRAAQYLMLYSDRSVFDHMNANWENFNGDLNADLFHMLRQMLMDVNVLYHFFLTNKEILERQNTLT